MGANPNTMTFKTVFLAEYQMSHFKQPVYQVLADSRFESDLVKGQTIARSYASDVTVNTMGADGSYVVQAIVDTQETLTIDQEKEASIYIKDLDLLQAHLPVKVKYARKLSNAIINFIDGDILNVARIGAGSTVDNYDLGGAAGDAIVITATNVATVFTLAMQKLMKKNVVYNANARFSGHKLEQPEGMPIAIITPEVLTFIQLFLGGKDTVLGDTVSKNGYRGSFMGFELFMSNALAWTATLQFPTIPVATNTITINGVVLTAAANGAAAAAGDYSISTTNDLAAANLVQLINGTGTPAAGTYIELSAANRLLLKGITASYNATTDLLTLVGVGTGPIVVSNTLPAADVWTPALQATNCIFGISKAVSLVMSKEPSMTQRPSPQARVGEDFIVWTAYGRKVFQDQSPQIVNVPVQSNTFASASNVQR
jgi:hypothetical protein